MRRQAPSRKDLKIAGLLPGLLGALLGACGGGGDRSTTGIDDGPDGGSTDAGGGGSQFDPGSRGGAMDPEPRCQRDSDLIDERRECVADDTCPCGSHCALGECVADCVTDSECGDGEFCDLFGRCRDDADPRATPSLVRPKLVEKSLIGVASSPFRLVPHVMTARAAGDELEFRLLPDQQLSGALRVRGRGVEVRCPGSKKFETQCREKLVTASPQLPLELSVRLPDDMKKGTDADVTVWVGNQRASLSVELPAGRAKEVPLEGLYDGTLSLVDMGVSEDPGDPGARPESGVSIGVTAEVFGSAGLVRLHDTSKLLVPGGEWIGELGGQGSDLRLDLGSFRLLEGSGAAAGDGIDVVADANAAPAEFASVGVLRSTFALRLFGVGDGTRRAQSHWTLNMKRVGDLPRGSLAPNPPRKITPRVSSPERPFEIEQAVRDAIDSLIPDPNAGQLPEVLANGVNMDGQFLGSDRAYNLAACALDAGEYETMVTRLAKASFKIESGTVGLGGDLFDSIGELNRRVGLPFFTAASTAKMTTSFESLDGEAIEGIPCAGLALTTLTCLSGENAGVVSGGGQPLDACDAIAEKYFCEPFDVAPTQDPAISTSSAWGSDCDSGQGVTKTTVSRACVIPRTSELCGELVSCWDSGAQSSLLDPSLPVQDEGDLSCGQGGKQSVALKAHRQEQQAARLTSYELRDACAAELDDLAAGSPAGGSLAALLGEGAECLEGGRLVAALGMAGAHLIDGEPENHGAATLFVRLLQQWIDIHAFLQQEAVETARLNAALGEVASSGNKGSIPDPAKLLERGLRGWELVLHPRTSAVLFALSDDVILQPDYRVSALDRSDGELDLEQLNGPGLGLGVAMIEALLEQLKLAELRAEAAHFNPQLSNGIDEARAAVHYAWAVLPLLSDWALRARTAGSMPAWLPRFEEAARALPRVMGRLLSRVRAAEQGTNPLGIEDEDLPLYFREGGSATDRFTAVSRYLLGDTPGAVSSWVQPLIASADNALTDVRSAWEAREARMLDYGDRESDLQAEVEGIRTEYGSALLSLCGKPEGVQRSVDVLDSLKSFAPAGGQFSATSCYIKSAPECLADQEDPTRKTATAETVRDELCVLGHLYDNLEIPSAPPEVRMLTCAATTDSCELDLVPQAFGSRAPTSKIVATFPASGCEPCMQREDADTALFWHDLVDLRNLHFAASEADRADAYAKCGLEVQPPSLPTPFEPPDDCYRGSLGEAALTLRSAQQELEIATADLSERYDAYDIAVKSCKILETGNAKAEGKAFDHQLALQKLRFARVNAVRKAANAAASASCAATLASADADTPWGAVKSAVGSAVACDKADESADEEGNAASYEARIDDAVTAHENEMRKIENDTEEKRCMNDARLELVAAKSAALRITQATTAIQNAIRTLEDGQDQVRLAVEDGRFAVAAAEGRLAQPLKHDFWIDEALSTYLTRFNLARRATYLAARAVEYEFQASLAATGAVLAAKVPGDLEDIVLNDLLTTSSTGGINGSRPEELKAIVSLRDDVLQFADRSDYSSFEQSLSPVQRLRLWLTDERFAKYDAKGKYLGQEVPFDLAPLETLGLGRSTGVGIFASNSCAERVWSINAALVGKDIVQGSDTSFADIQIVKANTFYSQWCTEDPDEAFQSASVRPTRNLFREADSAAPSVSNSAFGAKQGLDSVTRARLQPALNVSRAEFSDDSYENGASTEFAGRGLYGEYALFFPAGVLSTFDPVTREFGDGLDLSRLNDILLRVDYVSVAR